MPVRLLRSLSAINGSGISLCRRAELIANHVMSRIGMFERCFSFSRKYSVSVASSKSNGRRDRAFHFATSFSVLRTSYASSIAVRSTGTFQAARAYRRMIRNQTRSLFTVDGPAPDFRRARTCSIKSEDLISVTSKFARFVFSRNLMWADWLRPSGEFQRLPCDTSIEFCEVGHSKRVACAWERHLAC